jgi:hypothetical protein
MTTDKCPNCDGLGFFKVEVLLGKYNYPTCGCCNGTGKMDNTKLSGGETVRSDDLFGLRVVGHEASLPHFFATDAEAKELRMCHRDHSPACLEVVRITVKPNAISLTKESRDDGQQSVIKCPRCGGTLTKNQDSDGYGPEQEAHWFQCDSAECDFDCDARLMANGITWQPVFSSNAAHGDDGRSPL